MVLFFLPAIRNATFETPNSPKFSYIYTVSGEGAVDGKMVLV